MKCPNCQTEMTATTNEDSSATIRAIHICKTCYHLHRIEFSKANNFNPFKETEKRVNDCSQEPIATVKELCEYSRFVFDNHTFLVDYGMRSFERMKNTSYQKHSYFDTQTETWHDIEAIAYEDGRIFTKSFVDGECVSGRDYQQSKNGNLFGALAHSENALPIAMNTAETYLLVKLGLIV